MDYLAAIEEQFAQARGGGFSLSGRDIEVALSWERQGIPLDVVLGAMRAFDARAKKSPPRSLGAYGRAVEQAFSLARSLRVGARDVATAGVEFNGTHNENL